MGCHDNNQKSKRTGISYVAFQKNGMTKIPMHEGTNLLFMSGGSMTVTVSFLQPGS